MVNSKVVGIIYEFTINQTVNNTNYTLVHENVATCYTVKTGLGR